MGKAKLLATLIGLMALGVFWGHPSQSVQAANFLVTTTTDSSDGVCDAHCSLREAIIEANSNPDADTITLPAGTYTLTIVGTGQDAGDLNIFEDLTINGAGQAITIIDGNQIDRVFSISSGHTVVINDLTITNGLSADGIDGGDDFDGEDGSTGADGGGIFNSFGDLTLNGVTVSNNRTGNGGDGGDATGFGGEGGEGGRGGNGGGIFNFGNLTLNNSNVFGNTTGNSGKGGDAFVYDGVGGEPHEGGSGGGIYNDGGNLNLNNSFISNNLTGNGGNGGDALGPNGTGGEASDGGDGGGIHNEDGAFATIIDSTISNNDLGVGGTGGTGTSQNGPDGNGGLGGGIFNGNFARLSLDGSMVNDNTAGDDGGGIFNDDTHSELIVNNTTVSGNVSGDRGGGIRNQADSEVTITNSFVTGNQAGGDGGGIRNDADGELTIGNTTVSNNTTQSDGGGISNEGDAMINDSSIHSNEARDGAGIDNSSGTVDISTSTIDNNLASRDGSGIFSDGQVRVINSTINHNVGSGSGIGIFSFNSGTVDVISSTITDHAGFGVSGDASTGPINLTNTIVANNLVGDCGVIILVASGGHNLDSDGTCGFASTGDLSGVNPLLGPLANNGGPTHTQALANASPAVHHVPTTMCLDENGSPLTEDQRGFTRPAGRACDIGAFELRAAPQVGADIRMISIDDPPNPVQVGDVLKYILNVANKGPNSARVIVTHRLPGKVTFVSATPRVSQGTQGKCNLLSSRRLECRINALDLTESVAIVIEVIPTTAGTINLGAIATGDKLDPIPGNNFARQVTTVIP